MSAMDLDIHHYNYNELLNLFKLKEVDDPSRINENIAKMNQVIDQISIHYPSLQPFYKKSQKLILTIYKYLENRKDTESSLEIEDIVSLLKNTDHFENYSENQLLDKIIEKTMKAYHKTMNEYSYLNEPNLNLNKYDPSLNNKNNTNTINNTFPNPVAPGHLNPLKRITQNQNINLNSCFRHNYYQSNPSDFLYVLPIEIKNVLSIRLVSIEIPNAWYLFSSVQKNNFFQIETKRNQSTQVHNIVIPEGNYDIDTLQGFLNTTYFYQSGTESDLQYIKFSIHPYNLKSQFEIVEQPVNTNSPLFAFSFSLKWVDNINQNIMNTCGWILGFRLATYLHITDKIISEGLFDGGGDRYIYLALTDYQYNNNSLNTVCFDKSILNEDIIAKIPMINGKLSLIINDDTNPLAKIRRYTGPVNISKLHIKILDKFGTIIDLNNMDYSLTFELEILYESFNFKNVSV